MVLYWPCTRRSKLISRSFGDSFFGRTNVSKNCLLKAGRSHGKRTTLLSARLGTPFRERVRVYSIESIILVEGGKTSNLPGVESK